MATRKLNSCNCQIESTCSLTLPASWKKTWNKKTSSFRLKENKSNWRPLFLSPTTWVFGRITVCFNFLMDVDQIVPVFKLLIFCIFHFPFNVYQQFLSAKILAKSEVLLLDSLTCRHVAHCNFRLLTSPDTRFRARDNDRLHRLRDYRYVTLEFFCEHFPHFRAEKLLARNPRPHFVIWRIKLLRSSVISLKLLSSQHEAG